MIADADAGFVVALFVTEKDAERRGWRWWQAAGLSQVLDSRLTLLEVENTLHRLWPDHKLTDGDFRRARFGLEHIRMEGLLVRRETPAHRLYPESHRVVTHHFRKTPSGTLDILHAAAALILRGDAVHCVGNPEGVCQSTQRLVVEEINRLNGLAAAEHQDAEALTRIAQYEMAFKMQASVPDLTDFKDEPPQMLELYGVKEPGDGSFASNCLLARRLAERGVRFIQLYHRAWDHHGSIEASMPKAALDTDQACAALVHDLKQRGMLDDTLIIWGGEFGRTPMGQGSGRDHHINSFSLWLAGGGIKGGLTHGATDELGYRSVVDVVTMHDLHATLLHLCGLDHARFSVKFQGLDAKLTGVDPCRVVKEILA